eukprot:TRINITY_DN16564_c0_g1_i2.p1 TRINITY_DN16564_c0_g1~~TRINITY_DN16564_c0_g1_i2.p1  ORF type:complete len:298 (+),score=35.15 TRINITY_DN16564_c0_g1_i2:577-1470(+)
MKLSTLRVVAWALNNLVRFKPVVKLHQAEPSIPYLKRLLLTATDPEVLTDTLWAVSYISEISDEAIGLIVQEGLIPIMANFLTSTHGILLTPALRGLGNIVTGDDSMTEAVVNQGCVEKVINLMKHSSKNVRKDACFLLSNVAAGTKAQIQRILECPEFFANVKHCIVNEGGEIKHEALWIVGNILAGGSIEQAQILVTQGIISCVFKKFSSTNGATNKLMNAFILVFKELFSKINTMPLAAGGYKDLIIGYQRDYGWYTKVQGLASQGLADYDLMMDCISDSNFYEELQNLSLIHI